MDRVVRGKIEALKSPTEMLWKMTTPLARADGFDIKNVTDPKEKGKRRGEENFPWVIHGNFCYTELGPNLDGGTHQVLGDPEFHFSVGCEKAQAKLNEVLSSGGSFRFFIHIGFSEHKAIFEIKSQKRTKNPKCREKRGKKKGKNTTGPSTAAGSDPSTAKDGKNNRGTK